MEENPVKILYETSPEKLDALRKRLMPVGVAMEVLEACGKLYLKVTINDDIFGNAMTGNAGSETPFAAERKAKEKVTIASAFQYYRSHSINELSDYTGLAESTCRRKIARYKREDMWREDNDLLYF